MKRPKITFEVVVSYQRVWGDFGVEYCTHTSIYHLTEGNLIVKAMKDALLHEKEFLDCFKDDYGRIHWLGAKWKCSDENEFRTTDLSILNAPGIIQPMVDAKRNCNWK